jgi:hypothetical protein
MKYDAKIAKYTVTVQPFTWKKGEWIYYYLTAQDRAGNKAQTQAKEITIGR